MNYKIYENSLKLFLINEKDINKYSEEKKDILLKEISKILFLYFKNNYFISDHKIIGENNRKIIKYFEKIKVIEFIELKINKKGDNYKIYYYWKLSEEFIKSLTNYLELI